MFSGTVLNDQLVPTFAATDGNDNYELFYGQKESYIVYIRLYTLVEVYNSFKNGAIMTSITELFL